MRKVLAWGVLLVTTLAPAGAQAAFPGKNGKIAFQSTRDFNRPAIFVMNPDGSRQTNVSKDPNFFNQRPAWSPDGTRIAYDRGDTEIWTVGVDGSGRTRISQREGYNQYPSWSPSGAHLAFFSPNDILIMDSDGSDVVTLTGGFGPAWSPGGNQIAFSRDTIHNGQDIHVIDAAGGSVVNLSNSPGSDVAPNWSPDGTKIAFSSNRDGNEEIYVMHADGSNQVRLTNSIFSDTTPAWSPDGTQIAFARGNADKDIYVMDADGSGVKQLTTASGHDTKPDWQPDNTAPEPPAFLGTDPESPSRHGQPRIIGTAEGESTVRLYRDANCAGAVTASGPASEFGSRGLQVTALADGEHVFYGTATDLPGNVSACSPDPITYVRDTTAPHTTIDSGPGEGEETTDPTPTFTFSANEPVSGFECGLDGGQLSACESPYTTPELSEGEHVLVVRAIDVAGNVEDTPAQRRFLHRPPECANLWIPLPGPLPGALPGPDSVCA